MRIIPSLLLTLSLAACSPSDDKSTDSGVTQSDTPVDADGDGYISVDSGGDDCDDSDASVHPDADETCDGVDNNCDGAVDEGVTQTWYADTDGDGHGDPDSSTDTCGAPEGYVASADDCDDGDDSVYPDADERCDGLDNDCDGTIDEDVQSTWYADEDGDGYGDPDATTEDCDPPSGFVTDATDCDDTNDQVHPDAQELCDTIDDDCDGLIDDEDDSVTGQSTWYTDGDGDGYGDPDLPTQACTQPESTSADDGDCDDGDAAIFPGADEWCDGIDNDCDGTVDEDPSATDPGSLDALTWYTDADGDGYGDAAATVLACEQPSGTVTDDTDCDDADASSYPSADEVCDGADNDCDGDIDDDAIDANTYYLDVDGDGFGDDSVSVQGCSRPSGYAGVKRDCDDSDADINPWADEVCDTIDNDCDGLIDDEDDSLDTTTGTTFYTDADGDGFGSSTSGSTESCELQDGYSETDDDCDDTDEAVNPDAQDICNGVDDDCDGTIDPDAEDTDGDGITNCLDPEVYAEDFDSGSWGDWTTVDLGGSSTPNWSMSGGYLGEGSDAANTIAIGPDLGQMWSYTVTVTAMSNGDYNNAFGIAFGYESEDDYWLLRWLDPTDFYGTYTPAGQVDLYRCVAGTCDVLASDDDSVAITVANHVPVEISLTVDGEDISAWIDGTQVLSYTASGEAPVGAFYTGVWSWDNDYTVYYDDFEVTNP